MVQAGIASAGQGAIPDSLNGAASGEIPGAAIFFCGLEVLLLVDARFPPLPVKRIGVGLVAAVVVHDQRADGGAIWQGVGDGLSREVVDDQIAIRAEGAGVDEDVRMLRVEVLVAALDEGGRFRAQSDHPAGVVADGIRIGCFCAALIFLNSD
jgi:hypothetical protein